MRIRSLIQGGTVGGPVLFDRGPKPDLFLFLMRRRRPDPRWRRRHRSCRGLGRANPTEKIKSRIQLFRSLAATLASDALRIHRRNFAQAELGEKRLRPGSILFCLLTSAKTRTSFKLGQLLPKLPTERAFVRRRSPAARRPPEKTIRLRSHDP